MIMIRESARRVMLWVLPALLAVGGVVYLCGEGPAPPDEALAAGRSKADYPTATADVFAGMDDGVELTPEEIQGRNSWLMWTGGNERLWNHMAQQGYGLMDLLFLLDSRQRHDRFARLGLINEPGHAANDRPDEFGLFLDAIVPGREPQGVDESVYGRSTGVVGLRLFPNPDFDQRARRAWDSRRFYDDVAYRTDPALVRPYRVGMSCAFCHVAFHPAHPPADPEHPEWRDLSGTIGNQYFRNGEIFGFNLGRDDLLRQIMLSSLPGTLDTSILATDYNNNPNIINGIFNTADRLAITRDETVAGNALLLDPKSAVRPVPHVLVDGADTIGVIGALARVYLNIGTYSEEWLRCHNPILGYRRERPMSIRTALDRSVYWQVTVDRCANVARYLVRAGRRIPLADVAGGAAYLTEAPEMVERGKLVFAEHCFACHSGKQPAGARERPIEDVATWSRDPEYLAWARAEVVKPDFLEGNYLATDERIPVTVVGTNAARALQDNACTGHVWSDFSSVDYKATPSVGSISVVDPFDGSARSFTAPGNGPGFYRVPSLVAMWSSAPFLHNNALGGHSHDPSVAGRMADFDDAIRKMLWPERRVGLASVAVTQEPCYLRLPPAQLAVATRNALGPRLAAFIDMPWLLGGLVGLGAAAFLRRALRPQPSRWRRRLDGGVAGVLALVATLLLVVNLFAAGWLGGVEVGPVPEGFPINLLASIDPRTTDPRDVLAAMSRLRRAIDRAADEGLTGEAAVRLIAGEAGPALLAVNKAPDFVRDRGHTFGAELPDADKEALIAWLKRL